MNIGDAILDLIFSMLWGVASLLPNWNMPAHHFQDVLDMISGINTYFPLVELGECLTFYGVFNVLLLMWRPIMKFIHIT